MSQNPTIKLPAERLNQLKAIGAALDLSLADVIGRMIRAEIERGTISDVIPGIDIQRSALGVAVTFDSGEQHVLPDSAARRFADQITILASPSRPSVDGGMTDIDDDWQAVRIGNGIHIGFPSSGERKILSRDVARDVARLIKDASQSTISASP